MNDEQRKKRWSPWLSLFVIGGIPVAGILVFSALPLLRPELPQANYDDVTWTTYENNSAGFSLDVPREYEINESPDGIHMAWQGETIVVITHLTESSLAYDWGSETRR